MDVAVFGLAQGEAGFELGADGVRGERSEAAEPVSGGGLVEGLGREVLAQDSDDGVVGALPAGSGGLGEAAWVRLGLASLAAFLHEVAEPVGARDRVRRPTLFGSLGGTVRRDAAGPSVVVDLQRAGPLAQLTVLPDFDLEEGLGVETNLDFAAGELGSDLKGDAAQREDAGFVGGAVPPAPDRRNLL